MPALLTHLFRHWHFWIQSLKHQKHKRWPDTEITNDALPMIWRGLNPPLPTDALAGQPTSKSATHPTHLQFFLFYSEDAFAPPRKGEGTIHLHAHEIYVFICPLSSLRVGCTPPPLVRDFFSFLVKGPVAVHFTVEIVHSGFLSLYRFFKQGFIPIFKCMEPGEGDAGAFIFVDGADTLASLIAFAYWYRCTSLNLNARAKFLHYMMHLS